MQDVEKLVGGCEVIFVVFCYWYVGRRMALLLRRMITSSIQIFRIATNLSDFIDGKLASMRLLAPGVVLVTVHAPDRLYDGSAHGARLKQTRTLFTETPEHKCQ